MTDKEKIRKEVARIQLYTQSEVLKQILDYIDSMQEEELTKEEQKISNSYCRKFENKRVLPTLKGELKAKFLNEFNTLYQTLDMQLCDKCMKEPLKDLCLNFAAWGAYNLKDSGHMKEEKAKMDSTEEEPVSDDLDEAAKEDAKIERSDDSEVGYDLNRYGGFVAGANWQKKQFFRLKESVKLWLGKDEDNFEDEFAKTLAEKKEILPRDYERFSDFDFYRIALHFSGWKKRQMMKDSVDGIVYSQRKDMAIVRSNIFFPTDLKKGDKVKLIIIKED